MTVTVTNVNEAPAVANQTFNIAENSPAGMVVGTVVRTDPDTAPASFVSTLWAITAGDATGVFAINAATGAITVASSAGLNFEGTATVFTLTVSVTDNDGAGFAVAGTVSVLVTNVNEAPVVPAAQAFSVAEGAAAGTAVGTVVRTDPDSAPANFADTTWTIVSGNTNGVFALDAATGALTVAVPTELNFEGAEPVYTLVVSVRDDGGAGLTGVGSVTVTVTNVNEAPAIANQAFNIAENSAAGTAVGTVARTDPDTTPAAFLSTLWAITAGDSTGVFSIDTATGVISVVKPSGLDFEAAPNVYTLTVSVRDNDGAGFTSSGTVTVTVTNVNEAPAVAAQSFSVAENSVAGTAVGTVVRTDPDTAPASFVSTLWAITAGDSTGVFAIDAVSGAISVVKPSGLDFEGVPNVYTLTVSVTDGSGTGFTSSGAVTVTVTNVNEAPAIASQAFNIAENSVAGTAVGTVVRTDPDTTPAAFLSTAWLITGGNGGGVFSIDAASGAISVASAAGLNFEGVPNVYTLTVSVTDGNGSGITSSGTVTVTVTDVNEAPVFATTAQGFTVVENAAPGALAVATATDPDAGDTATLVYSLSGADAALFTLNAATGAITLKAAANFEAQASYTVVVSAKDAAGLASTNSNTVTVTVTNVNEAPAVAAQAFSVAENSVAGTLVGTVVRTDPDTTPASFLSTLWAITAGDATGVFAIDAATGAISVVKPSGLDFEGVPNVYTLTVSVTDGSGTGLTSSGTVTVTVTNVNEAPAIANQAFNIAENSAAGTAVGTVVRTDPDTTPAAFLSMLWAITAGDSTGVFSIDTATGAISVVKPSGLNFEAPLNVYTLTVSVRDNDGAGITSSGTVTVTVTNVNEAPAVAAQSFNIAENSVAGTVVGTVVRTDPDTTPAAFLSTKWSITAGDSTGVFAIDAATGVISVVKPSGLNFEGVPNVYTLTVAVVDDGGVGLTGTGTVTVSVTDVNEAPSFGVTSQTLTVTENAAPGALAVATATDPDAGDTAALVYSLSGADAALFTLDAATGAITLKAAANFEAKASYTVVVSAKDAAGARVDEQQHGDGDGDERERGPGCGEPDVQHRGELARGHGRWHGGAHRPGHGAGILREHAVGDHGRGRDGGVCDQRGDGGDHGGELRGAELRGHGNGVHADGVRDGQRRGRVRGRRDGVGAGDERERGARGAGGAGVQRRGGRGGRDGCGDGGEDGPGQRAGELCGHDVDDRVREHERGVRARRGDGGADGRGAHGAQLRGRGAGVHARGVCEGRRRGWADGGRVGDGDGDERERGSCDRQPGVQHRGELGCRDSCGYGGADGPGHDARGVPEHAVGDHGRGLDGGVLDRHGDGRDQRGEAVGA